MVILILIVGFGGKATEPNPIKYENGFFKKKKPFNRRDKYPAGFNLQVLGPIGITGVTFDYFVVPKIALEIGAGVKNFDSDFGFMGGGRYHFFGNTTSGLTPYLGLYSGFQYTGSDIQNYNLYIPFGIQKIKRNKFTWSIEGAYQRSIDNLSQQWYGAAKVGFRF